MTFHCYILESLSSGRLYIGQTNNLDDRINRHNNNMNLATRNRGPWKLFYAKKFDTREEAVKCERYLKSLKSPAKVKA